MKLNFGVPLGLIIIISVVSCKGKAGSTENETSLKNSVEKTDTLIVDYSKMGVGNFLIDSTTAKQNIVRFEDKIRNFPFGVINDKVSKGVWFDREAILLLAKYINDTAYKIDGVRMYFMCYDKIGRAEGQYRDNQSSIVIVPTNAVGKKHKDNWKILDEEKKKASWLFPGGLNHGELCPSACN